MIRVGLLGAGFIGKVHAESVFASRKARLATVYDLRPEAAQELAAQYGANVAHGETELITAKDIDAIIIATSTNTHADLLIESAKAGKPVYCEKPIDLSIDRIKEVAEVVRSRRGRVFMGFSRRFDATHAAAKEGVAGIGNVELVQMATRGPSVPPIAYIKVSGGQFRDQTIHFFDMLRWVTNDEPVEVYADGAALADPAVGGAGDVDTSMLMLKMKSGAFANIDNSRRAAFGYDERFEVFGSEGMVISERLLTNGVLQYGSAGRTTAGAHGGWFERIRDSFPAAMERFFDLIESGKKMEPGIEDGIKAQQIAEAAVTSLKKHRPVEIRYTI
jgi:myo-inositol 2-dehydrogenase/D-chiro-inositol 1-dehydrogenase